MRENTGLTDKQGQDILVEDILITENGEECKVVRKFGGWYRVWTDDGGVEWTIKLTQKIANQMTIKAQEGI